MVGLARFPDQVPKEATEPPLRRELLVARRVALGLLLHKGSQSGADARLVRSVGERGA